MVIRIYDKSYTPLTVLINSSNTSDFNNLSYNNKVNGAGEASFLVRIDNTKITTAVLTHFNRVEIEDDDGTVRWTGLIVEKNISLYVIQVKCYSLAYVIQKRITGANETYNGQANTAISTLLSNANSAEATGIVAGTIDLTTAIDLTFNRGEVWGSMKKISDSVDGQLVVNNDRSLDFRSVVGNDLTASVFFRFEKDNPENANILKFNVLDFGRDIISKTYGESGALTSTQENSTIKNLYGLLEQYVNFREFNDQTTLDNASINNNKDSEISPAIELSPEITDNFEAGDIITLDLDNDFIAISGSFQIIDKKVRLVNNQKVIIIKINDDIGNFVDDVRQIQDNVNLLNTSV